MNETTSLLAAIACAAVVVALVTRLRGGWSAVLTLSPAVGLGVLSIGTFVLLFLEIDLTRFRIAVMFLVGLLYVAAVSLMGSGRAGEESPTSVSVRWRMPLCVWGVVLATCGFAVWVGLSWFESWPHGSADAVNIWTSRGQMLARADGMFVERFALMQKSHPSYPLLLPTILAAQYGFHGSYSAVIPQVTGLLFSAALIAATWHVVARFSSAVYGAMAAAVVAVNPLTARWAFAQCADVPMAYFFLIAATGLGANTDRRGRPWFPPALNGFLLGLLLWTKNEGVVAAVVLVLLSVIFAAASGRLWSFTRRELPLLGLGIAPGALSLFAFRTVWCQGVEAEGFLGSGFAAQILAADRWRVILGTALDQTLMAENLNVGAYVVLGLLFVALFAIIRSRGNSPRLAVYLVAAVLAMGAAYFVAYLTSPYDVEWHVTKSIDRLLLQVLPTLAAGTAMLLASMETTARKRGKAAANRMEE